MHGVAHPIQAFSIPLGGVEYLLEILDALCRTVEAENAFDVGRWEGKDRLKWTVKPTKDSHTFFFQEDPTFRNDYGHVAVDETLPIVVGEGDGDIGIFDADVEGNAKDALGFICQGSVRVMPKTMMVSEDGCAATELLVLLAQ